ncbi:hypothetical protein Pfo_011795 [Paulownia fortunei]|nr:hypothetical protein Pfo_011795 [Paulownia fortunei]
MYFEFCKRTKRIIVSHKLQGKNVFDCADDLKILGESLNAYTDSFMVLAQQPKRYIIKHGENYDLNHHNNVDCYEHSSLKKKNFNVSPFSSKL